MKPVYTTCLIGMHLRFLRHMLLMARNVYCVGCREDISIKSSDRKDEYPIAHGKLIDLEIARFTSPLLKLSAIV